MYQALYRKYRPKNFDEIVGQNVIVQTLKNVVIKNNLTHAYLFTGPRGTGKTSIAKILAKTINCEESKNGVPCEKCVSCTQINNKETVDIIEIDAASNNGVDEIRELKSKVNLVPSNSKYKVYIIDEVHMLTTGAFNALLKTLEEPPAHIIFILATTEPHKIPATILSRCQRFDFKRISESSLIERLNVVCGKEKIVINEEAIREIARISDGGMRDALSLLDQVSAYSSGPITPDDVHTINGSLTQQQIKELVEKIVVEDLLSIMNLIDGWNETGKNFAKILEELIIYLKNLIVFQQSPEYLEQHGFLEEYYNCLQIDKADILNKIDILSKDLIEIKKTNMPKTIFEIAILKILGVKEGITTNFLEVQSNNVSATNNPNVTKEGKIAKSLENKPNVSENDRKIKEKLCEVKDIRINNALATFNKAELSKIRDLQENLKCLLINPDYSQEVSMILDGTLKAAGDDYLIYVFDNEANSDLFNQNLIKIEEIFEREFGKKYKVISTDIISWEIIKKEFNSKIKKYKYVEENINIKNILQNDQEKNEIENLFTNSIEYN